VSEKLPRYQVLVSFEIVLDGVATDDPLDSVHWLSVPSNCKDDAIILQNKVFDKVTKGEL